MSFKCKISETVIFKTMHSYVQKKKSKLKTPISDIHFYSSLMFVIYTDKFYKISTFDPERPLL